MWNITACERPKRTGEQLRGDTAAVHLAGGKEWRSWLNKTWCGVIYHVWCSLSSHFHHKNITAFGSGQLLAEQHALQYTHTHTPVCSYTHTHTPYVALAPAVEVMLFSLSLFKGRCRVNIVSSSSTFGGKKKLTQNFNFFLQNFFLFFVFWCQLKFFFFLGKIHFSTL